MAELKSKTGKKPAKRDMEKLSKALRNNMRRRKKIKQKEDQ